LAGRIASLKLLPTKGHCLTQSVTERNRTGGDDGEQVDPQTRRELVVALRARYAASSRIEKARILDEFTSISGYHRKSATRILNGSSELPEGVRRRPRPRLYVEAVRQALIVLWEASDRICGKRLKALLPVLLPALERNGHLKLAPAIRARLADISTASIDRLLQQVRSTIPSRRRKPGSHRTTP